MNNFPRSLLGAAIASVLAAPGVVWAQSADATLRGSAPANAEITARNVDTGTTRRTRASAGGSYTLAGLPPGTYRVDAGPGTETVVTLTVASTATLDLAGGGAAAPEEPMQEITVEGRRLNEVRTSEVGTTVSQQQIETTPQMTRNFLEFADAVPGMVFQVDGSGRTRIRGGAQNENGVNLYIDGVGQKGYVRSGVSGRPATPRAIRFHSSPSASTRSSPRTTRPSTTRSRARPSPPSPAPAPISSKAKPSALIPPTISARARRARSSMATRPSRRARNTASLSAGRSSRTNCISS